MPGRARNFRFRSCYKDGCISTSKTKMKIKIFVFVSAHVIRTLFLVTAHEFQKTKIWFFVCYKEWPKHDIYKLRSVKKCSMKKKIT